MKTLLVLAIGLLLYLPQSKLAHARPPAGVPLRLHPLPPRRHTTPTPRVHETLRDPGYRCLDGRMCSGWRNGVLDWRGTRYYFF